MTRVICATAHTRSPITDEAPPAGRRAVVRNGDKLARRLREYRAIAHRSTPPSVRPAARRADQAALLHGFLHHVRVSGARAGYGPPRTRKAMRCARHARQAFPRRRRLRWPARATYSRLRELTRVRPRRPRRAGWPPRGHGGQPYRAPGRRAPPGDHPEDDPTHPDLRPPRGADRAAPRVTRCRQARSSIAAERARRIIDGDFVDHCGRGGRKISPGPRSLMVRGHQIGPSGALLQALRRQNGAGQEIDNRARVFERRIV